MVVVRLSVAALVCILIRWVAVLIILSGLQAGLLTPLLTPLLDSWHTQLGLPRSQCQWLLPWIYLLPRIYLLPKSWRCRQLAA